MDNDNKHNLRYQARAEFKLKSFFRAKKHIHFNLTPHDFIILYAIARYLDMPNGKCFGKQTNLANECLMSVRQFKSCTKKLVELRLIERTIIGKLYHYYFGENITGIDMFV